MGILKFKTFGTDIYDMPIKAINEDDEILVDSSIEEVFMQIPSMLKYRDIMNKYVSSRKYWGDFEATQELLKYVNKMTGAKLIKPNLVMSIPLDGTDGPFGDIFKRAVSEAAISSGWRAVKLIENVYCAAIGAKVPIKNLSKILFVYSNSWCTYFSLIFAGAIADVYIIQSPINDMDSIDIINALDFFITNLPSKLPLKYRDSGLNRNHLDGLDTSWNRDIENKVYMAIPDKKKIQYGAWIGKYQAVYSANYEGCIINGLAEAMRDADFIL